MRRIMVGVQWGHDMVASLSIGRRGVVAGLGRYTFRAGPTADALYSTRHAPMKLHAGPWLVSLRRS